MAKIQYFRDSYGNTASIKPTRGAFTLVCRDNRGKAWRRSSHVSFPAARAALRRTGDTWENAYVNNVKQMEDHYMIIPKAKKWYKIIEFDGVRYCFSSKAYSEMLEKEQQYSLGFNSDIFLMHCDKFEVI